MKNNLKKTVFALALLAPAMVFTSCAPSPELDLRDAQDNLEDNDYFVTINDNEAYLELNQEQMLYAYHGDDSITIIEYKDAKSARLAYEAIKLEYDNGIKEIKLEIKCLEHLLAKYEKELNSDEIDDLEDEIKELNKDLEDAKEERVFGRFGKFVWMGTADAVKDSKD